MQPLNVLYIIFQALAWLARILIWAIILRAVLSWFIRPSSKFYKYYAYLLRFTEPLIRPFRPLLQRFMTPGIPIDLAPLCSLLVLQILERLFYQMAYLAMG